MRILALGDVVGSPGRKALQEFLPDLRRELNLDLILANGENSASGRGMTDKSLDELFRAGVDIITSGNHTWRFQAVYNRLNRDTRVLRPANFPAGAPGRGSQVFSLPTGLKVGVLNIQGLTYMSPLPCPFEAAKTWVAEMEMLGVHIRLVDFHAEATGEKKCMGFALDGKVSAILGTHTHVQSADAQILPQGSAYLTDLGMCGVELSSLGFDYKGILQSMTTRLPQKFQVAKGPCSLNGAYIDIEDASGRAREIRTIRVQCPPAKVSLP